MDIELNRDGTALICVLYREYCQRRKQGMTIEEAAYFGDGAEIHSSFMPKWQVDDISHLCWYLHKKGLLLASPGDDCVNAVSISDDGICYMEQRYPEGLKQIIETIATLAPLVIPWI